MNFEPFDKRAFVRTPDLTAFVEPYFFFTYGNALKLMFVSASVDNVLGFAAQELLGRPIDELFSPAGDSESEHETATSPPPYCWNQQQQRSQFTMAARHRLGHKVRLEIQTYAEQDGQGNIIAIHGVARKIMENNAIAAAARAKLNALENQIAKLSDREQQVLNRVLNGRLNKSIAKELEISERAVERIRARVMKKFQAGSTAQMISMATQMNLLKDLLELGDETVEPTSQPSKNNGIIQQIVQN